MRQLLAILALATLGLVPALPAAALTAGPTIERGQSDDEGIGIRLVDIPAATQKDPRARSYIVDNLPPGSTINRRIEVRNHTSVSQEVRVYPGAARIDNGAFVPEPSTTENDLVTWTSVDKQALHLGPDESAMVMVTVKVPADAAEGEQYAAVWAEVRSKPNPKTKIASAMRVGVRMYVSVGPGNGPAADFAISGLSAGRNDKGEAEVRAAISNTGGRALDVSGTLSLTEGPSGLAAGPFPTQRVLTLAPGSTGEVLITLGAELPNGPWHAALQVKSGLVEHDATARLTFPAAGASVVVETEQGLPAWLIVAGGIAGAALVALVVIIVLRRRRRPSPRRAHGRLSQDAG